MRDDINKGNYDILLIHPSYHRRLGSGTVPPIGLANLVSFLSKTGFTSKILDCSLYFDSLESSKIEEMKNWLRNRLTLTNPRLAIGIGPCTTSSIKSILAVTDVCREVHPQIPLIFGGPLTLILGQEWLFFELLGAFAIVKGDGEYAVSNILTQLREGKALSNIPGVQNTINQQVEPNFIEDLNILPHPYWDLFNMSAYKPSIRRDLFIYPFAPVIGSRGCPHSCSFCISGQLIKYRRYSFEYIIEQVRILRKKHNIRSIIFYDDSLFPYTSNINEEINLFADLLFQSTPDVLWQIEIRPDVFSQISDSTFQHIFSCGCHQMNIGIEKASALQLKLISKSFDIKQLTDTCKSVAKNCQEMRLTGTFILGGPKETLESIHENIEFSTQLNLLFAHYYPLELYPGTPAYRSVCGLNNKEWFDKIINDNLPWGEIIYEDVNISSTQLMELTRSAYRYFYDRNEWKELAKHHLGRNYEKVQIHVKSWLNDRFQLKRDGGI
ncbi:MAG TPA: radical SAM protein [Candidatus Methanoperedens sp.]